MDTILETNEAVETVRQAFDGTSERPRPEWVRGVCPQCGEELVSNCYVRRFTQRSKPATGRMGSVK